MTENRVELDEIDDDPVTHVLASAADAPPPVIRQARTVFELATIVTHIKHGAKANKIKYRGAQFRKVQADGVTINTGSQYPCDRPTPEKAEAEIARRARQTPPKPIAAFRRTSKRFAVLIGEALKEYGPDIFESVEGQRG